MNAKITHNELATELLSLARIDGINRIGHIKADRFGLHALATAVRGAVLDQVTRGMWAKFGVTELDHMVGLRVTARRGTSLIEPPIVLEYDFKRTKIPRLAVYRTARPGGRA